MFLIELLSSIWQTKGMNKLRQWLEAKPGRSTQLANALGIAKANITPVKNGMKRCPPGWIMTIVRFTNGWIKPEDLLPADNTPRKSSNQWTKATA